MASENADGLPTREQLAERVRELEAHVNTDRAPVSRRGALAALLGAGGLAAASQPGAAQSDDRGTACTWLGDQNAAGYDLFSLSHNFMGTVSDTPGDDEYASGEVAVYVKNDDNLYIRPNGGSEQQVSGTNGSGPWSDLGSDTDGGNDYGLPNAADNIDLQGDGRVANADLISTGEGLNSSIGDSVDYLNPAALLRFEGLFFFNPFNSIDGIDQATSGSGSISIDGKLASVTTGTTDGSYARLQKLRARTRTLKTFDKNQVMQTGLRFASIDSTDSYLTVGRIPSGNNGFGFKVDGSDLIGVVHNGTSETTTTLISGYGTPNRENLRAELRAGSEVEFFVNGTSQGTISSGLPSGATDYREMFIEANNQASGASETKFELSEWNHIQLP